jgi:hypothetical protein
MGTILEHINPAYFWDVKIELLDEEKSKKLIIERVFSFGNLNEIELVHNFYGEEPIVMILKSLSYIDPKTLNFISLKYNIPKSRFKCHRRRQSMRGFWG